MAKAKIYLYKEGNECVSLTGGWKFGRSNGSPTRNKNENNLEIKTSTTGHDGAFVTTNAINISKFSKMNSVLDYKNYRGRIIITDDSTGNNNSNSVMWQNDSASDNFTNKEVSVDFNIDNNRYFSIMSYAQQNSEQITRVRKIWLETKENVLTINSHEDSKITFSANDLGLVTINKIDVLVNGIVSQTYTDNYSNLSYTVDKSLYCIGNNNIEIRVTYSQGDDVTETVSEYLTYKYDVSQLPLETPLINTVKRVKLLTKSKQYEKDILSSILTSKNVEVSEEDKMSDLIGKVDLLGEYCPPLYLYKEGDKCNDITGGWDNQVNFPLTYWQSSTKGTFYSNYIACISSSLNAKSLATTKKIDVSKCNKLYVEAKVPKKSGSSDVADISLSTALNEGGQVATLSFKVNTDYEIYELNISSLSGEYYVRIKSAANAGSSGCEVYIKKIWLEE